MSQIVRRRQTTLTLVGFCTACRGHLCVFDVPSGAFDDLMAVAHADRANGRAQRRQFYTQCFRRFASEGSTYAGGAVHEGLDLQAHFLTTMHSMNREAYGWGMTAVCGETEFANGNRQKTYPETIQNPTVFYMSKYGLRLQFRQKGFFVPMPTQEAVKLIVGERSDLLLDRVRRS